jgi:hypothetical protein
VEPLQALALAGLLLCCVVAATVSLLCCCTGTAALDPGVLHRSNPLSSLVLMNRPQFALQSSLQLRQFYTATQQTRTGLNLQVELEWS